MKVIVDTNVPIAANKMSSQATPGCIETCIRELKEIERRHTLVLDDGWRILREYQRHLKSSGQPGVGDRFLKWALINRHNPQRCEQVHITASLASEEDQEFAEFPQDLRLAGFDRSDRKFVAVALAHPERPPILNA
ncbi:MAG: hypothetical protein WAV60_21025, partial [Anaerolineae bacterium]